MRYSEAPGRRCKRSHVQSGASHRSAKLSALAKPQSSVQMPPEASPGRGHKHEVTDGWSGSRRSLRARKANERSLTGTPTGSDRIARGRVSAPGKAEKKGFSTPTGWIDPRGRPMIAPLQGANTPRIFLSRGALTRPRAMRSDPVGVPVSARLFVSSLHGGGGAIPTNLP